MLSLGQSGTDVAIFQAGSHLNKGVVCRALGAPVGLDGDFNIATQQAVQGKRSYFGLTVYGIVGTQTLFVFEREVGPNTIYGDPVFGSRELSLGMTGGDVTILQNRINGFRYA